MPTASSIHLHKHSGARKTNTLSLVKQNKNEGMRHGRQKGKFQIDAHGTESLGATPAPPTCAGRDLREHERAPACSCLLLPFSLQSLTDLVKK